MLELKLNASSIASFMDASSIKFAVCKEFMMLTVLYIGSRDGAVVRALASYQCDLGSILGPDAICGLSLLLVLFSAREVFPRVLRFFPLLKNQHFQIPVRSGYFSGRIATICGGAT